MAARILLVILLVQMSSAQIQVNDGLMDRLSSGMKFAQNFLGSESVALKVAEFVVRAFQANSPYPPPNRRQPLEDTKEDIRAQENRPSPSVNEAPNPLRQLVKLFGLQPSQISAVAVNALLFVAKMISTFLSGPKRKKRPHRSENPTSWILTKNSRNLQQLIEMAKNESLPNLIEDLIEQQGSEEETSCIKLLACKITPFVLKMQKAVFGKENEVRGERGAALMYRHLPTREEVNQRSDVCEKKHRECDLNE